MKAELQADGTLIVSAETAIEAYALRRWDDGRRLRSGKSMLEIRHDGNFFSVAEFDALFGKLTQMGKRHMRLLNDHPEEAEKWAKEMETLDKSADAKSDIPVLGE
jgi:hypothetical protein